MINVRIIFCKSKNGNLNETTKFAIMVMVWGCTFFKSVALFCSDEWYFRIRVTFVLFWVQTFCIATVLRKEATNDCRARYLFTKNSVKILCILDLFAFENQITVVLQLIFNFL